MKKRIGLLVLCTSVSAQVEHVQQAIKELRQDLYHLPTPRYQNVAIRCRYKLHPWVRRTLLPTLVLLNNSLKNNSYNQLIRNRAGSAETMKVMQEYKRTLERLVKAFEQPSKTRTQFLRNPASKERYDEIVAVPKKIIKLIDPDPTTGIIDLRAIDDVVNTDQQKLGKFVEQIRNIRFLNKPGTIDIERHIGRQKVDVRPRCNEILGDALPWIIPAKTRFTIQGSQRSKGA